MLRFNFLAAALCLAVLSSCAPSEPQVGAPVDSPRRTSKSIVATSPFTVKWTGKKAVNGSCLDCRTDWDYDCVTNNGNSGNIEYLTKTFQDPYPDAVVTGVTAKVYGRLVGTPDTDGIETLTLKLNNQSIGGSYTTEREIACGANKACETPWQRSYAGTGSTAITGYVRNGENTLQIGVTGSNESGSVEYCASHVELTFTYQPRTLVVASPSEGSLSFGNQKNGTTSRQLEITVRNNGEAPVRAITPSIHSTSGGTFTLTTSSSAFDLNSGVTSSAFRVTFTPGVNGGAASGILSFTSNETGFPAGPTLNVPLSGTGVASPVDVIPESQSLTFAAQRVDTTSTAKTVTVRNVGASGSSFNVTGVSIGQPFYVTPTTGGAVTTTNSLSFNVTYKPVTASANQQGKLIIQTSDPDRPTVEVLLSGTGVKSAVTLSQTSLDFAPLRVGNTSTGQTVTVGNPTGTADLNVSSVSITGPFEVSSRDGFTVQPGGTPKPLIVTFKPMVEGENQEGVLTVHSDDPDKPAATVALLGTGTKPILSLSPDSLTFPPQRVGSASDWQTVTVRNDGSERLSVNSVTVSGPFELMSGTGFFVEPKSTGDFKTLSVKFRPTVDGPNEPGLLTFNTNEPGKPTVTLALSGTGVKPTIVLSPSSLNFGSQRAGTLSEEQTVTVRNDGSEQLNVTSVTITGPFELSSYEGFPVASKGSKTLAVRFRPGSEGAKSGELTFVTNEPGKPTATLALSGSGVVPKLVVTSSPNPLDFGEQRVGTISGSKTVTVSNATGSGPITITSISTSDGAFVVSPDASFTLAAGDSKSLSVTFKPPMTPGDFSGTLTLTTDYAATGTFTVALSGKGVKPTVEVLPTELAFGPQTVGTRSDPAKAVKVRNSGTGTLRITSISASANYELDSTEPFSLTDTSPASRERTLLVKFYPSIQGSLPGTITFNTNDENTPRVTINLSGTGEALLSFPSTSISSPINFGNVRAKTTAEQEVTFTNNGSVPIKLKRVLDASAGFSLVGLSSEIELKPGFPSVTLKVKFSPMVTGEVSGIITVESTATNSPHTLYLKGTGTESRVQISLSADPTQTQTTLDFKNVELGNTEQGMVKITNTGGAPLDVTSARIVTKLADGGTAPAPAAFEYRGPPSRQDIPPDGGYIEFPVAFTPTQNTNYAATLIINSNAVNSVAELPLNGDGVSAQFTLSSYSLAFGNQRAGDPSPPKRVQITNTGKVKLKIQGFTYTNGAFSVSDPAPLPSNFPMEIPVGDTGFIDVIFTPSEVGLVTGIVKILSNAKESDSSVTVTGFGLDGLIDVVVPSTDEIAFGGVEVGASSERKLVRLTNTGEVPLDLEDATIENPSEENPFIISGFNRGLRLNKGDVHEFFVTFRPLVNGYQSATLAIKSDSYTTPKYNLTVAGTGEGAEVELLRPSVGFSKTNVGLTDTQTLSIRNKGVRTLQIYDLSFERKTAAVDGGTPGNDNMATDFSVGRNADGGSLFTMSVDAGAVVPIDLKFSPTAVGFREAKGVINSNAKTVKFDVSGEGTSASLVVEPSDGGLTFQGVLLGSTSTAQIRVINDGTGSVDISSITLNQTGNAFTVSHTEEPIPLPPKASETIFVTFSPTEALPSASAQLLVLPSSTNVPRVLVNIVGLGVREPISVDRELEFGQQLVENTSLPRTLNIANNTDSRINLTSVTVSGPVGTDCAQFSAVPLPTSSVELVRTRPFLQNVTFRPRAVGDVNCVLKLSFAQFSKEIEVPVHGKGIPAVLSISPATLDFGGVRAATGSREEPITLMNLSSDPITLGMPEVEYSIGEPFIFNWASLEGEVLQPGQPVIKKVKYQPAVESSSEAKLHFGTTSPLKPRAVPFKMLGKATKRVLYADVESLDFGRLDAKAPAQTKTVTITNKSPRPQRAVVTLKTLEGSPFALDAKSFAESIPPEGTVTLTVTFDPDKAGEAENEVVVRLQDLSEPEVQIPVKGIGRILTGTGGGCSCGTTEAGSAGMLMLLALVGLGSRRRKLG